MLAWDIAPRNPIAQRTNPESFRGSQFSRWFLNPKQK